MRKPTNPIRKMPNPVIFAVCLNSFAEGFLATRNTLLHCERNFFISINRTLRARG